MNKLLILVLLLIQIMGALMSSVDCQYGVHTLGLEKIKLEKCHSAALCYQDCSDYSCGGIVKVDLGALSTKQVVNNIVVTSYLDACVFNSTNDDPVFKAFAETKLWKQTLIERFGKKLMLFIDPGLLQGMMKEIDKGHITPKKRLEFMGYCFLFAKEYLLIALKRAKYTSYCEEKFQK
jgi:hypothetical protein